MEVINTMDDICPRVSHSPAEFIRRCTQMYNNRENDEYILCALTGKYCDEAGITQQVFLDLDAHYLQGEEEVELYRDIDSIIRISDEFLVDAPVSACAVPHTRHEVKTLIHVKHHMVSSQWYWSENDWPYPV